MEDQGQTTKSGEEGEKNTRGAGASKAGLRTTDRRRKGRRSRERLRRKKIKGRNGTGRKTGERRGKGGT